MPTVLKELNINDIEVSKDRNPRQHFDEDALHRLAASIKTNGLIQPIAVSALPKGKYQLIAGERRLRACKIAKVRTIPAQICSDVGDRARALALVENILREDLNPIEEAEAYSRIMAENGWNQKQLAAEVGVSSAHVSQRLSLLRLPQATQKLMASSRLSLDHTKTLRDVAHVSPEFTDHLAKLIAGESRIEREHISTAASSYKGFIILLWSNIHSSDLEAIADEALADRFKATFPNTWEYPYWTQDDIDAARTFGCLVSVPYINRNGERATGEFVTDRTFLAGRLEQKIDRAKQSNRDKAASGSAAIDPNNPEHAETAQQRKADAQAEREALAKIRAKARSFNTEIGEKLALALHEPDFTLERMQLLARVILNANDNRHLGQASFALTDSTTTEVSERGTMKIMPLGEAAADLQARVDNAKTPQQILGVLLQAFISSQITDGDCLPVSTRPHYRFPRVNYDDPAVCEQLALTEALAVFTPGTNTHKRVKKQLRQFGG